MKKLVLILFLAVINILTLNAQTEDDTEIRILPLPLYHRDDLSLYKNQHVIICDTLSTYNIINDSTITVNLKNRFSGKRLSIFLLGKDPYYKGFLKGLLDNQVGFYGILSFVGEQPKLTVINSKNILKIL